MTLENSLNDSHFRLTVRFKEESYPPLLDISGVLYDFNLLYEITRLATDPRYDGFQFNDSFFVLFRNSRPLSAEDRLYVEKLSHQSPLELITVVAALPAAAGAIWAVAQATEKLVLLPLNRAKLKLEIEKLERENQFARPAGLILPTVDNEQSLRSRLESRGALHLYNRLVARLERSRVRLQEVVIEVIERLRKSGT